MNTDREHSEQRTKQQPRGGSRGMTVGDWLPIVGALLVALVIALGIWAITWQLGKLENQRTRQAQKIEYQRAETERELAGQRAQDEALQVYLDQMSQLMLDRKLLEAEPGDPVHILAQARTSTAILGLDAEHNESVTHFLINSELSVRSEVSARLLRESTLSHATLSDAHLPNADLSGANVSEANLIGADLSGAVLLDVDLSEAVLDNTNLSGAEGITNEEIKRQAASLEGADMPNGQSYEEWLKGSVEAGENGGSP